ncbi:MAG: choice-of-anchor B family protein [Flavobacteriales bacterium]|nr:choice-of-anchor B family protein [Flavobacteriales bacterium]
MRSLASLFVILSAFARAQTPCVNGFAGPYPCSNIDLMAQLSLTQLGTITNIADLWGWTDPLTAKEYAIVGGRTGTSFVDISIATAPVLVGFLPAHNNVASLWRDVDTHGDWCFIGSEAAGHGLQVFDLTRLRDVSNPPETFAADARFGGFGNSHSIFVDKTEPYVYAVGTNIASGGLVVVNVSNPLAPTLAGTFPFEGYIHENSVYDYHGPDAEHQGKRISFNFHIQANDRVTIVDVTDKSDMELISTTPPYTSPSLCHQGWLTEDHRYLLMNDEGDESSYTYNTRTHIFDVQDLDAPVYLGFFSGPNPSIDHNLYVHRNLVWEANYTSGLHVLDAAQAGSGTLSLSAWFDTYPANNGKTYNGAWGNYPYFPSGNIIISSFGEGLFIVKPRLSLRVRAMLEGPYDADLGLMHDSLRVKGLLPLLEPYTALGYAHAGGGGAEMTTPAALLTSGPDAIVDWVVLELRDAADPSSVLATRSALIQRDGDIVGADGSSPVQFSLKPGPYHVAVRHRNHLGAMTAAPVEVSVALRSYDLSDGSTALYGISATKPMGPVNPLWAGDCLRDGVLRYTGEQNDRDPILSTIGGSTPTATATGYLGTDTNMDGTVRYTGTGNDRDPILVNVGGNVPTATRNQQLP